MPSFSASPSCSDTIDNPTYSGIFEHDRGTKELVINDNLISSVDVAVARAKSELVKGAYVSKWASLTTTLTPNLKQNDIISFKGFNWIVKEITITFNNPKLLQKLKVVRYV